MNPMPRVASVQRSLRDLRLERLDAIFVHWSFPNHHPPMADTDARDPQARPYLHEESSQIVPRLRTKPGTIWTPRLFGAS
jgi:diketogulonate reductase-like aldo/keto reductase